MNLADLYEKNKEVTYYYTATKGIEYIFRTEVEAIEAGLDYEVATWNNINDMADCGHHFPGVVVCTPQGKFKWVEVYEENYFTGEMEMAKCMYRAYGAPESFSEQIEEYLEANYNENGQLHSVVVEERNGSCVYVVTLSSDIDGRFVINSLGGFIHM
ncbi:hypothetical protein [Paenibacillus odorifer]|uniref:hypothetical protein n=1 Tax=Paenibacillus odorifer TaxID=189426 RepID=UPI00096E3371|nr:hypothetical protein [Paenibacillus odorifer]OMD78260.1 hypothetical protein BSK50_10960 [Paenibacillus odorifer]